AYSAGGSCGANIRASCPRPANWSSERKRRVTMPSIFGRNVSVNTATRIRQYPLAYAPVEGSRRSGSLDLLPFDRQRGVARAVVACPGAGAGDLIEDSSVCVLASYLGDLDEQAVCQCGRRQPQAEKGVVAYEEVVLRVFLARVRHVGDLGARQLGDQLGEVPYPVRLCHLVDDAHPVATLGSVLQRQLDAADRVLDVDEGPRLPTGPVDGQGEADGCFHEEAVEDRTVIAVVVEAVYQPFVEVGLGGVGAPHDALMQVGDP